MGVQIELPSAGLLLIRRTDGWACMDHQIPGVGFRNRDVEEANGGGIAKLLIGNQLKHRRAADGGPGGGRRHGNWRKQDARVVTPVNRAAGAKSVARATKHPDTQASSAIDLQIACPTDTGLDRRGHFAQKGMGISTSAGSGATPSTRSATIWPTTTIEGDAKASASARSASSPRAHTRWRWPFTVPC